MIKLTTEAQEKIKKLQDPFVNPILFDSEVNGQITDPIEEIQIDPDTVCFTPLNMPSVKEIYREKGQSLNSTRFDYIPYDEVSSKLSEILKESFKKLEKQLTENLIDSREKSLVLTHLEESWMWVGKSIKISQEKRNKESISS